MKLHTVGHGTLASNAFAALVRDAGVRGIVDVRSYPGSRHSPQFGSEEMAGWLPDNDITYWWLQDLGGRRKPLPQSRHHALRHPAFRGYADHMDTPQFLLAVEELVGGPDDQAVMCSETVWWRCHRRLLADHLTLIVGVEVVHLMHDGRRTPHTPTEGVRQDGDRLTYDVGAQLPLIP